MKRRSPSTSANTPSPKFTPLRCVNFGRVGGNVVGNFKNCMKKENKKTPPGKNIVGKTNI